MELLNCSVKRNVERIRRVAWDIYSPTLAYAFHVRFTLRKKGHEESDYFHFLYTCICTCLLSTIIKAVKSFPPLKVWNFAVYGHVHVLICMVCHKETKKTRANVVFVCILYTFFCFRFLTYFSFLFF